MAPPSAHTRKRQYQPSNQTTLNSYFGRNATSSQPQSPMSPPLDEDTQAGLLSVGMRVRKSMQEGYKTHKTLGSAGYPFLSPSSSTQPLSSAPARPSMSPMNSRELIPFCGLHKTGGLAAQELPASSAPAAMRHIPAEEDMPGLSYSQGSMLSTQNSVRSITPQTSRSNNKRNYEEDAEEDMDAFFDEADAAQDAVNQQPGAARPIARMKSSSRKPVTTGGVQIVTGDDFEDATFLVPMDVE